MERSDNFLRVVPSRTADVLASDYRTKRAITCREDEFDWIDFQGSNVGDDTSFGFSAPFAAWLIVALVAVIAIISLLF